MDKGVGMLWMAGCVQIYKFKGGKERWRGKPPDVCVGPLSEVAALINPSELRAEYGGYAVYVIDDEASEYIGVWGTRNASRFREVLRERGATLELIEKQPPNMRLKTTVVT